MKIGKIDVRPGVFDDRPAHDETYWGGAAIRVRKKARGGLAVYYLGIDRKSARVDQGTAREIRHTFGSRVWGVVKQFDYNYEVIGQTGSFGNGDIGAFAVGTDTGFNFRKVKFQPRLGLRVSVATGDRDPRDVDLQSFNPLYHVGTAYSRAIALVGPTNLADLTPSLQLYLNKKIRVLLDTSFYWRQSFNDGDCIRERSGVSHPQRRKEEAFLRLKLRELLKPHESCRISAARMDFRTQ